MINEELRSMMALSLVSGIGPAMMRKLIAQFGSATEVFRLSPEALAQAQGVTERVKAAIPVEAAAVFARVEKEIQFMEEKGVQIVTRNSPNYPRELFFCNDAPELLYQLGDTPLGGAKCLSIVGTRKPSADGKAICEAIVADIAKRYPETVIVSGLAYGVDVCAHRAAMKHGLRTVGVLAHGLDTIYPPLNRETGWEVARHGALLTEYMSRTRPEPQNFIARNRIVAGMSRGVLVIESASKGGSLITAARTLEYGHALMAVPGSPCNERARGCNMLIRKNHARLVESLTDIEDVLGWRPVDNSKAAKQGSLFDEPAPMNDDEKVVYGILKVEGEMSVSTLSVKTQIPVARLSAMLLTMEFAGLVKPAPGNAYRVS